MFLRQIAVTVFNAGPGSGNPSSDWTSISIDVTLIRFLSNSISPGNRSLIKQDWYLVLPKIFLPATDSFSLIQFLASLIDSNWTGATGTPVKDFHLVALFVPT